MNWYRVKVNAAGEVRSCEQVEACSDNGLRTFYVKARDERSAKDKALSAYRNAVAKEKVDASRRAGICARCHKNPAQPGHWCAECQGYMRSYKGERRKERLETDPTYAPKVNLTNDYKRLEVLLEVKSVWECSGTIGEFARWLATEINRLSGSKAA